jgi:signal transduction histidine kinase
VAAVGTDHERGDAGDVRCGGAGAEVERPAVHGRAREGSDGGGARETRGDLGLLIGQAPSGDAATVRVAAGCVLAVAGEPCSLVRAIFRGQIALTADGTGSAEVVASASMRDELVSSIRRHGDELLAGAITALLLVQIVLLDAPARTRLVYAAGALALGAVAARRVRMPLLFLGLLVVISVAAAALPELRDFEIDAVGLFILLAVYTAAAHTGGRRAHVAAGLTIAIYVADLAMDRIYLEGIVFLALLWGAPWVVGRAVRRRRLSERRVEEERTRAQAAIVEERARIARELHDVVAHAISVIVLQARGARRVLDAEPADTREALETIERTGRQALEEMRRLLGMLRTSDEQLALAPQPGLKELGRLVEQVQAAGLPVQVVMEGEPRELPPGVDLSAYRIVQEALTNALKHAGPARARVLLRYDADELGLEIADDGAGSGDGSGSGQGLIGMRERVSVYGGELEAGRRPGGGYALRARLPLGAARP